MLAATAAAALLGDDFIPRLLAISVVLQIIFAGLCAFELMRQLAVRPAAAWIGATVFELGCFFAAQTEHLGAMQGAVWLPLIWLSVLRLRTFNRKWLAVLVVSLAMTVLAGLPQVAVAAFGSAVCLALLLALFRMGNWKVAALVPLACAWAILVAAIQFFPTAELTQNSIAKYRAEWMGSGGGMPPGALLSLLIPNYWNVFNPPLFHGPTDLTFLYLYSSLLGLALALAAIFWRPDKCGPRIRSTAGDLHLRDARAIKPHSGAPFCWPCPRPSASAFIRNSCSACSRWPWQCWRDSARSASCDPRGSRLPRES